MKIDLDGVRSYMASVPSFGIQLEQSRQQLELACDNIADSRTKNDNT